MANRELGTIEQIAAGGQRIREALVKAHPTETLGRDVSHRTATEQSQVREAPAQNVELSLSVKQPAQQMGSAGSPAGDE